MLDVHLAIERLYQEYQQIILAYLTRLVRDPATAEDLCQETFLKALRSWAQHDQTASVVAWLYRIATNTAYDYLRRRKRVHFTPLLEAERRPGCAHPFESRLEAHEPIRMALAQMLPRYRVPLLLASEGLTMSEIAAVLGCSTSAVKMRLFRARARFREVYHPA